MKKISMLVAALLVGILANPIPAHAAGNVDKVYTTALTEAVPTLTTQGLSLGDNAVGPVMGYRVTVEITTGSTLTSGTIECWYFSKQFNAWILNPDLGFTIKNNTQRRQVSADFKTEVPIGRVFYRPNAVVVAGGGTVLTIAIEARTL